MSGDNIRTYRIGDRVEVDEPGGVEYGVVKAVSRHGDRILIALDDDRGEIDSPVAAKSVRLARTLPPMNDAPLPDRPTKPQKGNA